jgi:hypothetical protein
MRKLLSAISVAVGFLSLTPPGKKFLEAYFWDRVFHFINPVLDSMSWILVDYGPAAVFLALAVYLSTSADYRLEVWHWAKSKLNIYYVVAILGAGPPPEKWSDLKYVF